MNRWRYLLLPCVLTLGLAACAGGSGSSGFDIHSENAAIEAALTGQRCVQHESLTICPAAESGATPSPTPAPAASITPTTTPAAPPPSSTPGTTRTPGGFATATASPASSAASTPTPSRTPPAAPSGTPTVARTATVPASATPTATATPTSGVQQVEIAIDPRAPVLCASTQDGGCAFVLPFAVSGFPPGATFRVAVRTVNPNGGWMISEVLAPSGPAPSAFAAPVDISTPISSCCGSTVQAAVLAFVNPPASVPAAVDELVDTGADAAFVTEPFTVQTG